MAHSRLITVVSPVLNEEMNLLPFYEAVTKVTDQLPEFDWEFLFVDDGSTDRSMELIRGLRDKDPRVRAIQLSRNFGSYPAYRAGFEHARGDAVIAISCDLQDSPEAFVPFTELWTQGHEIVWGVRAQRDDPWSKTMLAGLFYRLMRLLSIPDLPEQGMDSGLFDRKVIDAFCRIPDATNVTFLLIYWMGFRQARVPCHRKARERGESKWPLGKRIKSALDVVTWFSYMPMRFSSYVGWFFACVGLLGAAVVLFNKLFFGIGWGGWPSLMIVVLVLGGIQLIILGMLGEYLWRISAEVRGFPKYIIKDTLGFDSPVGRDSEGS
jgi:polyisoprenyl-phosphate glycosyltransferase